MLEFGLTDAVDADDLHVKLLSLKDVWDELVPDFHAWFLKRRLTTFNECLVLSVREEKGISGRYYSNGLELKHRLQKKKLNDNDIGTEIVAVTTTLEKWIQENFLDEVVRAIYGQGKYRLATGYQQFLVDAPKFLSWSKDRQNQHVLQFMQYNPASYACYKKPSNAGKKGKAGEKRRARQVSPELFTDRIPNTPKPPKLITPVKSAEVK